MSADSLLPAAFVFCYDTVRSYQAVGAFSSLLTPPPFCLLVATSGYDAIASCSGRQVSLFPHPFLPPFVYGAACSQFLSVS
jgi:hypothetical protein